MPLVQSKSGGSAAPGSTFTVTLDAAPTPGNVLVAAVSSDTSMTAGPSGFTQRCSLVVNQGFYVYTRTVQAGDGASVTVDPNGDHPTAMVVAEFYGTSGYEGIATTSSDQGTALQVEHTTNAVTPSGSAIYVAVHGLHTEDAGTIAAGAAVDGGFTIAGVGQVTSGPGGNRAAVIVSYIDGLSGAKSVTATWTSGVTDTAGTILALTWDGTFLFTPPTVDEGPAGLGPLFYRYKLTRGISLLVNGSTVTENRYPNEDDMAAADDFFIGGHEYLVNATTAAILAEAGYGSGISVPSAGA